MSPKSLSLISSLVNFGLAIAKLLVGLLTHSIALMAEALHSSLDVVSSFIAFLGIKTAEKPADQKHPYGYERYESLASFVVVFLLFISGCWILFEAIKNILTKETTVHFSLFGIILMAISIVINEIMARFKFSLGNRFSSLVLVSDAEHSRADAISSLAVLFGLVLIKFYPVADSILAVLVAFYIFYESYHLSRESIDTLVDTSNPEIEDNIKKILKDKNYSFSNIKTRKIGFTNFAEISLLFDSRMKIDEVTALTKSLEEKLLNKIPELKQISFLVKSHDFTENVIRPWFGRRFRFRKGWGEIGPEKMILSGGEKTKRIIIPVKDGKIPLEFSSKEYLVIDINEKGQILQKPTVKNPYFESQGRGHGVRFVRSVSADKVITKHIGENAKRNLEALGIEIEIIDKDSDLGEVESKLW